MATFDRSFGTASEPSATDARLRRLYLDWSAIFGGTVLGWGLLFLLSAVGAAIGFAAIDPYAARPGRDGDLASSIWGGAAMLLSSIVGSYAVVRISGDRRRNEALLHGAVSWGISMIAGALLAFAAASTVATSAAPAAARRASPTDRVTRVDRQRLEEASNAAARTTGIASGAALLSFVGALLGALIAASRQSGVSLRNELRMPSSRENGRERPSLGHESDAGAGRDHTTILPPSH